MPSDNSEYIPPREDLELSPGQLLRQGRMPRGVYGGQVYMHGAGIEVAVDPDTDQVLEPGPVSLLDITVDPPAVTRTVGAFVEDETHGGIDWQPKTGF